MRITTGWELDAKGKAKQVYETLGYYATRKDAMMALSEYHNNPIDLNKKDLTFEDAWNIWTPKHFELYPASAKVLKAAYNRCEPIKKMPVKDIRKAHLQAILDSMAGMSETSQRKVKTVFKFTFKYCLENDIISKDYSQFTEVSGAVKTDSGKKYFTPDELRLVMANLDFVVRFPLRDGRRVDMNLTDTLLILLYTGMRIGELLEQKSEDVDLSGRIIRVRGTKTDNADRLVPIHRELIPILEKRLGHEYLISDASGRSISYARYLRSFYNPFKAHIRIEHTPHAVRHTFISLMDSCGVSSGSVVLKRIVGHSNTDVTQHYTHKERAELIETIDRLKIF